MSVNQSPCPQYNRTSDNASCCFKPPWQKATRSGHSLC